MGGLKLNPISQPSKEIGELASRIAFLESEVVRLDRALNNLGRKYHEHHVNNHAVYGNTKGIRYPVIEAVRNECKFNS